MAYGQSAVKGITIEIGADATTLQKALKEVDKEFTGLKKHSRDLKKLLFTDGEFTGDIKLLGSAIRAASDEITHANQRVQTIREAISNWETTQAHLKESLKETTATLAKNRLELEQNENAGKELAATKEHLTAAYEKLNAQLQASEPRFKELDRDYQKAEKAVDKYQKAIKQLHEEYRQGKYSEEEYEERLKDLSAKLERNTKLKDENRLASQKLKDETEGLKSQMEPLRVSLDNVNKEITENEKAHKKLANEIERNNTTIDNLTRQIENEEDNLEKLNEELNKELANRKKLIAERERLMKLPLEMKLRNEAEAYQVMADKANLTAKALGKVSTGFDKLANIMKYPAMASGAGMFLSVKTAMDFESAWAGVLKTVDGTEDELNTLNEGLKTLATSTASSYEDIAKFAELGGQMGVPIEKLTEFTDVIVKLGDTTNIEGEEAAQTIAKFANVMQDAKDADGQVLDQYYRRLGSTIVDLGNNFATTELDIMNMAMRMGAAASQVGMTSDQTLALAASLSSLGLRTDEAGSSASKIMNEINLAVATGSEDLEAFAMVSGTTVDEFVRQWQDDAPMAFLAFLEAIGQAEEGSERLVKISEAGFGDNIRVLRTLSALTGATDLYTNALELAGNAWDENSAMDEEAARRYGTMASQISQLVENIKQLGVEFGEIMMPTVKKLVDVAKGWIDSFKEMSDSQKESIINMGLWTIGSYPMLKGLAGVTDGVSALFRGFGKLNEITGKYILKSIEQNAVYGKTAGQLKKLVSGLKTSALSAGSTIAVLGAVAAAVGVIAIAYKNYRDEIIDNYRENNKWLDLLDKQQEKLKEQKEVVLDVAKSAKEIELQTTENAAKAEYYLGVLDELNQKEELNSWEKAQLKSAVESLNAIYPDLRLNIDEITGKLDEEAGSHKEVIEQIKNEIEEYKELARQKASQEILENIAKTQLETEMELSKTLGARSKLLQEQKKITDQIDPFSYDGSMPWGEYSKLKTIYEELGKELNETATSYNDLAKAQSESIATALKDANWLETQDWSTFGKPILDAMESVTTKAGELGFQIPGVVASEIQAGSGDLDGVSEFIANMQLFTPVVEQANEAGQKALTNLAQKVLENAPDVQTAADSLATLITFASLYTASGIAGTEIGDNIASGFVDGSLTAEKAMSDLEKQTEAASEEMASSIQEDSETISGSYDDTGKAAKELGENVDSGSATAEKAVTGLKDTTVSSMSTISSAVQGVWQWFKDLFNLMDNNNGKTIGVTIRETRISGGGGGGGSASMFSAPRRLEAPAMRSDLPSPASYALASNPYNSVVADRVTEMNRNQSVLADFQKGIQTAFNAKPQTASEIVVPVTLLADGRPIAKATARYTNQEIQSMNKIDDLLKGVKV